MISPPKQKKVPRKPVPEHPDDMLPEAEPLPKPKSLTTIFQAASKRAAESRYRAEIDAIPFFYQREAIAIMVKRRMQATVETQLPSVAPKLAPDEPETTTLKDPVGASPPPSPPIVGQTVDRAIDEMMLEPTTPTAMPEIPDEIPPITNFRGGRGLMAAPSTSAPPEKKEATYIPPLVVRSTTTKSHLDTPLTHTRAPITPPRSTGSSESRSGYGRTLSEALTHVKTRPPELNLHGSSARVGICNERLFDTRDHSHSSSVSRVSSTTVCNASGSSTPSSSCSENSMHIILPHGRYRLHSNALPIGSPQDVGGSIGKKKLTSSPPIPNPEEDEVEEQLTLDDIDELLKPPSFGPLLNARTVCALCREDMLQLNGTELKCGHFVHGICLRDQKRYLHDLVPVCGQCGDDCVPVKQVSSPDSPNSATSSVYTSSDREEYSLKNVDSCDVEPLLTRSFVMPSKPNRCDLTIRVHASKVPYRAVWHHRPSDRELKQRNELSKEIFDAAHIPGSFAAQQSLCGKLRLASKFSYAHRRKIVSCFLFERYIIVTAVASNGFDELISMYDLTSDLVDVYHRGQNVLVLEQRQKDTEISDKLALKTDKSSIATWISAVNNDRLSFYVPTEPITPIGLAPAIDPGYIEIGTVEVVLCLPFSFIKQAVPHAIASMGPQDRLGIVVLRPDGRIASLSPHKVNWPYWNEIIESDIDSCKHFEFSRYSILDTADTILPRARPGKQQSIIVTSDLPLGTLQMRRSTLKTGTSPLKLYMIGLGDNYNLSQTTELHSTDGPERAQLLHTSSFQEMLSCIGGIVAADKYSRHHSVRIKVKIREDIKLVALLGVPNEQVSHNPDGTIEAYLGNVTAGQSKSILVDLEYSGEPAKDLRKLAASELVSISAATGHEFTGSCMSACEYTCEVAPQICFDRITRRVAGKFLQSTYLDTDGAKANVDEVISDAIGIIERTAKSVRAEHQAVGSLQMLDLIDPSLSVDAVCARAKNLIWALRDVNARVQRAPLGRIVLNATLLEAIQIMHRQIAYTCRTDLERFYFEGLELNRI